MSLNRSVRKIFLFERRISFRLERANASTQSSSIVPVFKSCLKYKHQVCLKDSRGEYTFLGLAKSSRRLSEEISRLVSKKTQERVALICMNNAYNVIGMWAAWMSGQIVVPVQPDYPETTLEYILRDSETSLAITTADHVEGLKKLIKRTNIELLVLDPDLLDKGKASLQFKEDTITEDEIAENRYGQSVDFYSEKDALLVYTAGATGIPKGVLLSFRNLNAQISATISPWSLTSKDCILNCRPLSSTDGISSGLLAPLSIGGSVILKEKFMVEEIWSEILGVQGIKTERMNIFFGDSRMYRSLVEEYENVLKKNEKMEEYIKGICIQKIRLMIATNTPLPRSVQEKWESYTGHEVIEAYALSEGGIVSTPRSSTSRHTGTVGLPVPGLKVKIMSDDGSEIAQGDSTGTKVLSIWENKPVAGTLWLKGDGVARTYWGMKAEEKDKNTIWTVDGWFKTGDIVSYNRGLYNLLGKLHCDIVRAHSYKISLLQIEAAILDFPGVNDVAAFCLTHDGKASIAAAVAMKVGEKLNMENMKTNLQLRFPHYAVPDIFFDVPFVPRNHKGKLVRKEIKSLYVPHVQSFFSTREKGGDRKAT